MNNNYRALIKLKKQVWQYVVLRPLPSALRSHLFLLLGFKQTKRMRTCILKTCWPDGQKANSSFCGLALPLRIGKG